MNRQEPIHPNEVSLEEACFLIRLARRAVEEYLNRREIIKPPEDTPEKLFRHGMVFTTIETYHSYSHRTLRGCIGFLQPVYPLVEAAIRSAIEAAFRDPRFPPLEKHELDKVTFELSILSIPVKIEATTPWDILGKIVIGRHGLVVKRGWYQGTLLPQVPIEYCWDQETFLAETCLKAGLEPDCWLDKDTEVLLYEGRVFREKEPHGEIEERDLSIEYKRICRKD